MNTSTAIKTKFQTELMQFQHFTSAIFENKTIT